MAAVGAAPSLRRSFLGRQSAYCTATAALIALPIGLLLMRVASANTVMFGSLGLWTGGIAIPWMTGAAVGDSSIPTDTTTTMATAGAGSADAMPGEVAVGPEDLVIQTVSVEAFLQVGVYVNPDDGTISPSHSATVSDGPMYDTPREALEAFLV